MLKTLTLPDGCEVGHHLTIKREEKGESIDTLFLRDVGWIRLVDDDTNTGRFARHEESAEEEIRDTYMYDVTGYDHICNAILRMVENGTYTDGKARSLILEHSNEGVYAYSSHHCVDPDNCVTCMEIDATVEIEELTDGSLWQEYQDPEED